jgi:hypothetical protein
MTVKEFVDVVNDAVINYAKIYEMRWREDYQHYFEEFTNKRVQSKKDLEPYYDYEIDGFELNLCYGEYDDSAIYIKMPKKQKDIPTFVDYEEQRMLVLEQQGGVI